MKKKHSFLLGAHVSIAGGIHLAIERGQSIGCTTLQIFTKNNRQWHANPLNDQEIAAFKNAWEKSSIQSVIAHASYIINVGSPHEDTLQKSIDSLTLELNRCARLEIPYLVLHPGSHGSTNEESCLERVDKALNKVLSTTKDCTILLETMAGQGNTIGYIFEHLAQLIQYSKHKDRLGICFDTCHVFAAGYDFTTEKSYAMMWEQFDKIIGINKVKAFHINDSQKDFDSRVDRHADIGKGKIGLEAFKLLCNDPLFFDIPKILETPKEDLHDDKRNMKTLLNLLTKETRILLDSAEMENS